MRKLNAAMCNFSAMFATHKMCQIARIHAACLFSGISTCGRFYVHRGISRHFYIRSRRNWYEYFLVCVEILAAAKSKRYHGVWVQFNYLLECLRLKHRFLACFRYPSFYSSASQTNRHLQFCDFLGIALSRKRRSYCQACVQSDLQFNYFGVVTPGSTNDSIAYPTASGL